MDTEQKLCILHLLDVAKEPMDRSQVLDILTQLNIFNPLEIDIALGDLVKNNLINQEDNKLFINEEGLVVIEFFRDRIGLDLQKKIEDSIIKRLPQNKWQIHYDKTAERLYIDYEKADDNLLHMEITLDQAAYQLIKNNLENLEDKDFVNLKKFFLNV